MNVKRILVLRTGAIGDTIVMSVVYQALRKSFPEAWIEAIGHVERLRLINTPGLLNCLTPFESGSFSALFLDDIPLSEEQYTYFRQFDVILVYRTDPEDRLYANLCKICPDAMVYRFDSFPRADTPQHITAYLLQTLEVLGIHESHITPKIVLPELQDEADHFHEPYAVIHPGSGSAQKNWPLESFIEICRRLVLVFQIGIKWLVGPAEEQRFEALEHDQFLPSQIEILQNVSLPELAHILRHCQFYLGNDSGVSHLAAAAGVPTIALFGPSDPQVWCPSGPKVYVLRGDGRPYCQGISVEDVWQTVRLNFFTDI